MHHRSPARRVLIVEDEPLMRWSLSETLAESGCSVLEAGDGAAAVRTLSSGVDPIDCVLLDYQLPDSRDLTLLATLRRLAPKSEVIMMTAYGSRELREGALALGASRVVDKPFDMSIVPRLVGSV